MSTTVLGRRQALLCLCVSLVAGCAPATKPVHSAHSAGTRGETAAGLSMPQASLVSPEAEDPNAVAVSSVVRKVTVYSDRALVTREAKAKLRTEPTVYVFKD